MITEIVTKDRIIVDGDIAHRKEFVGLSTDTKPTTGVSNGDKFFEMNTKKNYMYNGASSEWVEV